MSTTDSTSPIPGRGPVVQTCTVCGRPYRCYPCNVGRRKACGVACGRRLQYAGTHGQSRTRLHNIWCGMKARCTTDRPHFRRYYKDRGIVVCAEWLASFEAFREWALANGYQEELELDRRDGAKGYSPDNCRWATRVEQMRNTGKRRTAKTSKYKGVSRCGKKWRVQVVDGGRRPHVAMVDDEIEAAKLYDSEVRKLFGEFANTNFKD